MHGMLTLGLGDDTRLWAPPYCGGQSTYFLAINRNKKVINYNKVC